MYVSKFEPPKSNENFIVHGQADYYQEYENKKGQIAKRRLFEVTCKSCGNRLDMRKACIIRNKSCGCMNSKYVKPKQHKIYDGKTLLEWEELSGVPKARLYQRMRRTGMTIHEAISLG